MIVFFSCQLKHLAPYLLKSIHHHDVDVEYAFQLKCRLFELPRPVLVSMIHHPDQSCQQSNQIKSRERPYSWGVHVATDRLVPRGET